MTFPQIIAITGKKQHGKDTVGNYLAEKYGYIRLSFADAIKDMLRVSFGFSEEQLNGSQKENVDLFWKITPRQVMQYVGTELFRDKMSALIPHVGQNFWVLILKKKIYDRLEINPEAKFVIPDLRFQNELDFVNEMGGFTISVVRPEMDNNAFSDHSSETTVEQLKTNINLINSRSIEHLQDLVDQSI
jgi:hypothetical protein